MACYYTNNKDIDKLSVNIVPLVMAGVVLFLIMAQPDLGTATIFIAIVFFIFISLPITRKAKSKCLLIVLGLVFVFSMFLLNNGVQLVLKRQLARLDFTNPCSAEKFYSSGNQVCNGYIAINNGGLLGKGLGNSTQKYLYLPEAYTDFIFAIVMEELGLVVSIIILILYFIVLWRIYLIAKQSCTDQGAITCYGIFLFILFHIIVNLGGLFGLIPLTGVPLPFLSYGGSFTMCLIVALTIVQRINYETKDALLKKMNKGRN
jgi:cell division protein FtsW